jgi:amino acid adenylation domain-containing protein
MTSGIALQQLAHFARHQPHALALVAHDGQLTYGELWHEVQALRVRMRETMAVLPQHIGLLTGDDRATYVALLAILAEGRTYVPLNAQHPADRHTVILEDAEIELVLGSRQLDALAQALQTQPNRKWLEVKLGAATQITDVPPVPVTESQRAYILYTSGSTGKPKGVPIHYAQLDAFLRMKLESGLYTFTPEDRFLQMFELTFDLSVMCTLLPLCVGASIWVVRRSEGMLYLNVLDMLEAGPVTVALMVPSILAYLQPYFAEIQLPELRLSLFCGEALPHQLALGWSACVPNAQIENVYGPTEATIYCSRYVWQEGPAERESENGVVPIGLALPGMHLAVVNEQGEPQEPGQSGELVLYGPQVTTGYWNNDEKTTAAFHHWPHIWPYGPVYRTGDRAHQNSQGNFVYEGRMDTQVKVDGFRVELGEIEHHIRTFTQTACAVLAVEAGKTTTLHAFIERFTEERKPELLGYLQSKLPPYMLPRQLHLLPLLPLNSNGKVDRPQLRSLLNP